jgi:LuxR family maltose regulon positive regulatory protein
MIEALHGRASAWFANHGQIDEAIQHAVAAGDAAGATRLVEQHAGRAVDTDWSAIERWLGLLPAELIQSRPALLLAQCWVAFFRHAWGRIGSLLDRTEALLATERELPPEWVEALRAEINAWRAYLWVQSGDGPRAVEHAQRAWDHLPATSAPALGRAGAVLAMARRLSGQPGAALAVLHDPRVAELDTHPVAKARLVVGVAYGQLAAANLPDFETLIQRAREIVAGTGHQPSEGWIDYWLGRVHYEWNHLEAAREHYAAAVARRDRTHFYPLRGSLQGLALTCQAMGRSGEAVELADSLVELALATRDGEAEENARAFRARLALLQGDLATAVRWLHLARPEARFEWANAIEVPAITRARVLVAQRTEATLREGLRGLEELLALYEARHETLRAIELLALQALAHRGQSEMESALAALERALALAAPGGLIRTFVDLGPPLAALLVELARRTEHGEYVSQLLSAFKDRPLVVPATPSPEGPFPLFEPLTDREVDVLQLLAARYTNKEIASRLQISRHTVTSHTVNIYQKLQVTGRRDAAQRARELGLLK